MTIHFGLLLFLLAIALAVTSTLATRSRQRLGRPRLSAEGTGNPRSEHAGSDTLEIWAVAEPDTVSSPRAFWMRVVVTLLVLLCALFLILSKQSDGEQQKWAYGVVGIVLGYWLKA